MQDRWVRTEDVPYIRAIRYIPEDMKQRLPGEYWDALDTPVGISLFARYTLILTCAVSPEAGRSSARSLPSFHSLQHRFWRHHSVHQLLYNSLKLYQIPEPPT